MIYLDKFISYQIEENAKWNITEPIKDKVIKELILNGSIDETYNTLKEWQLRTINALKLTDVI